MVLPFSQVDVFTGAAGEPFRGNPVAVVHDADALDETTMAAFARWTNLSETTFLVAPSDEGRAGGADYRLRIFTPGGELPFAGHPTLGSAWAWLQAGGTPRGLRIVQECGVGLVPVDRRGDELAFAAPPLLRSGLVDAATLERAVRGLGLADRPEAVVDAAWVDNGPGWLGLLLDDAATVLDLRPDLAVGVVGPYSEGGPSGAPADVEVRAFAPAHDVPEDPVTGSLNAGLALWLLETGRLPDHYVASQGTALGRAGRVHVDRESGGSDGVDGGPEGGGGRTVWVGGRSRVRVRGTLDVG